MSYEKSFKSIQKKSIPKLSRGLQRMSNEEQLTPCKSEMEKENERKLDSD